MRTNPEKTNPVKTNEDFAADLRAAAAELRQRRGLELTDDEIFAYVNGELVGARRGEIEEAIALDPEAARLARDFALFSEDAGPGEPGYLSPAQLDEDWRKIQARIALRKVAAHRPFWAVARSPLPLALAACLALAVGWGLFERNGRLEVARELAEEREPQLNLAPLQLREPMSRGSAPTEPPLVQLEARQQIYLLEIEPQEQPTLPRYRIEVRPVGNLGGAPLWSADDLEPRADWIFSIALPRQAFKPGTYELRVLAPGVDRPAAVFHIEIPAS